MPITSSASWNDTVEVHPCYVQRMFQHKAIVTQHGQKKTVNNSFLEVALLKEHPQKHFFGGNVQVWWKECEFFSFFKYILVEDVLCEAAYIAETVKLGSAAWWRLCNGHYSMPKIFICTPGVFCLGFSLCVCVCV